MADSVHAFALAPQTPIRLVSCGRLDLVQPTPQSKRVRDCFVAYVVLSGGLDLIDFLPHGPERFRMRAGDVHVIAPGLWQASAEPSEPGTSMLWIHFAVDDQPRCRLVADADEAVACLHTRSGEAVRLWMIPRHLALAGDLDGFLRLYGDLADQVRLSGASDWGSHAICGHLVTRLHRIFTWRLLAAGVGDEVSPRQAHVLRAREFIRMNYDKRISAREVAAAVGVSAPYLSRCFQQTTGGGLVDFLLSTRIQAAKELLAEHPSSVKEVARQCGFSAASYFCRVFRRLEGRTPMAYAAMARSRRRG